MNRIKIILVIGFIICGQILQAQIHKSYLKEYAQTEANEWQFKLSLSNYKTEKLAKILLEYKIKEGEAVLDKALNIESAQKANIKAKNTALISLFTKQEYKLYTLFNEYSKMDRVEYLNTLMNAYSEDIDFINEIVTYRENSILPVLRVHRAELEDKISKADKEVLNILRVDLYDMLDRCIIDCKAKHNSEEEQYEYLAEVLFKELTAQVAKKTSPMHHLIVLTKKYEEEIYVEKSHFEKATDKWAVDLETIQKKYVLDVHLNAFKKTMESNSIAAWEHLRFNSFFLLLDPSTEEESKKILKLGMIMLPHLEI